MKQQQCWGLQDLGTVTQLSYGNISVIPPHKTLHYYSLKCYVFTGYCMCIKQVLVECWYSGTICSFPTSHCTNRHAPPLGTTNKSPALCCHGLWCLVPICRFSNSYWLLLLCQIEKKFSLTEIGRLCSFICDQS